MSKVNFKNKWAIGVLALFGVSLISAGVFASASITLNSNGTVNLGAGAVAVNVCDQQATIATQQTYDATDARFELTTISLQGLNYTDCAGKTINIAMKDGSTTYMASWAILSSYTGDLVWGGTAGSGQVGSTALPAINTAASQISTIAISAQ